MSDWEEEMYDDESEEYSFDDDSSNNSQDKDDSLQDWYFKAKACKEDNDTTGALELFTNIINRETNDPIDWEIKFKATKQSIKVVSSMAKYDDIIPLIDEFFKLSIHVDNTYIQLSILKMLNRFERSAYPTKFISELYKKLSFYLFSMDQFKMTNANISRIKVKVQLGTINAIISMGDFNEAIQKLQSLESECDQLTGQLKNTYMLDIITLKLKIMMISNDKIDIKQLKKIVKLANELMTGIPHARIVGTVNEANGIVAMYEGDYPTANNCFRDSFKGYNDAADDRRIEIVIKYIMSTLVSRSVINPFESSDFQGFLKLEIVKTLMKLYDCIQITNVDVFNQLLNSHDVERMCQMNHFIKDFIPVLIDRISVDFLILVVPLFEKITFKWLIEELKIDLPKLEKLLLTEYNKGNIYNIKIDFESGIIRQTISSPIISPYYSIYDYIDRANALTKRDVDAEEEKLNDIVSNIVTGKKLDSNSATSINSFSVRHYHGSVNEESIKTFYNEKAKHSKYEFKSYHLDIFRSSIPTRKNDENCNKIQKIGKKSIELQFKLKYRGIGCEGTLEKTGEAARQNQKFLKDPIIPDIVQTSSMGVLDPPLNPDKNPYKDLTLNEKKLKKMEMVYKIIQKIDDRQAHVRLQGELIKRIKYQQFDIGMVRDTDEAGSATGSEYNEF